MWATHGVGAPLSGIEHLHHPVLGDMTGEHASVQAHDDVALDLALYSRARGRRIDRAAERDT